MVDTVDSGFRAATVAVDRVSGPIFKESAMTPSYWQQASADLAAGDARMGELVERYAGLGLVSRGDPFATLARSIVGQQISVKAADSVWGRFAAALSEVSPQAVVAAGEEG
ncbi:MAG: hypothetical protein WAJ82_07780, partial [Azonexus sp.]